MRKTAAITAALIACASAIVMTGDAEARRLRLSFGGSAVAKPAVPMSKPVVAPNSSAATGRGGVFIYSSRPQNGDASQNRPMAAAPLTSVPEHRPLHELASVMDQTPAVPEKPTEKAVESQPEPPAAQTTPVFVSMAAPARPAEKPAARAVTAAAQPGKMVYCAVQPNGGCAPF